MDWITGIQNAINYIEDHIMEEPDYEQIAGQGLGQTCTSTACLRMIGER